MFEDGAKIEQGEESLPFRTRSQLERTQLPQPKQNPKNMILVKGTPFDFDGYKGIHMKVAMK